MITFRDPPPLPVRVESLKKASDVPGTFDAPIIEWLIVLLLIAIGGVVAAMQKTQRSEAEALAAAFTNSLPRETERGVLRVLPIGAKMTDVRARLDEIHATCRGETATDSVVTCLGFPIVRANTYARLRVQFTAKNGTLAAVDACPTFVHWSTVAVPSALAERVIHPAARDCWRDESNLADNAWTYATLPDKPFTVRVVHAADSVSRTAPATADTLIVRW